MAQHQPYNDIQPTKAIIYIGKTEVNFASFRLEQAFGNHHQFGIKADFNALGKEFMSSPLDHFKLIGETVDVDIRQGNDSANAYLFRGIIQNVAFEGEEGKHGYVILRGSSPTILLERGKRYDVFMNQTLAQTFGQVCDEISNQKQVLPFVNASIYEGQVEFLMQYNESDWTFLRRLSSISHENLYWTGRDLVFGIHKEFPTIEVTYDREITNFEFGNRYLSNNRRNYQYLPENDDTLTQETPQNLKEGSTYVKEMNEKGETNCTQSSAFNALQLTDTRCSSLDSIDRKRAGRSCSKNRLCERYCQNSTSTYW